MDDRAQTQLMFTLAFIASRYEMRRRLTGALAEDPTVPERSARAAEQRTGQPVDRRRPGQRSAHVSFVAPQCPRGDVDLL